MPPFAPLTNFLQKASRRIRQSGGKIAPQFEDVRIHHFRTRIKKLRAVLDFAASTGSISGKKGEVSAASKKLYKAAGEVRDAQVLLLTVSALQEVPLPRMALWLAGRIADAQNSWRKAWKAGTLKKLEQNMGAIKPEPIRPVELRRYFRLHLREIKLLAARQDISDEDLHDIRKRVKALQYLLSWAKGYWPEGHAAVKNCPWRKLKALGELAGDYNDLHNAIAALRRYARDEEDDTALQSAGTVLKAWETERIAAREKLVKAVGRM